MIIKAIHKKLFIVLTLAFMATTVIGTLTHELGHYTIAKLLGYESVINYQSASMTNKKLENYYIDNYKKYKHEIDNQLPYPNKDINELLIDREKNDRILFLLGGPIQTMLTGSFGLCLLLIYKQKTMSKTNVNSFGWLIIFLSLFWLRQSMNLAINILGYLKSGNNYYSNGDEFKIADYLNINKWSIALSTGCIGALVLVYIVYIIPKQLRLTFILSGLIGGCLGYFLWFNCLGEILLP